MGSMSEDPHRSRFLRHTFPLLRFAMLSLVVADNSPALFAGNALAGVLSAVGFWYNTKKPHDARSSLVTNRVGDFRLRFGDHGCVFFFRIGRVRTLLSAIRENAV